MKVQYRWLDADGTKSVWYDESGDHLDEAAAAAFEATLPDMRRLVFKFRNGAKLEYRRAK